MKHHQNTIQFLKYKHITKDERNELAILLKKGYSLRNIAEVLGRNPASVSREVKNNSVKGRYEPDKAQHKAYVKRLHSKYQGMKIRENQWLEKYIQEKLILHWSPEQIAGRLKMEIGMGVSFKTIYKYLYNSYGQYYCQYLKYKRYGRRKRKLMKSVKEVIKNRIFIDQRPEIINERLRFGDFEADTLGIPKTGRETLIGLVERKSRYIFTPKEVFEAYLLPKPLSVNFQSVALEGLMRQIFLDSIILYEV